MVAQGQHPQLTTIRKECEPKAGKGRFGDFPWYLNLGLIFSFVIWTSVKHSCVGQGSSAASAQRVHVRLAGQVLQHFKTLTPQVSSQR